MEFLNCQEMITLEGASMRIDKEKGGTDRRIMSARVRLPVPAEGMFQDLPAIFHRLFEDAKDDPDFEQAKTAYEITGQRVACFPQSTRNNPLAVIDFADLRNIRLCRDPENGRLSIALAIVFDYTNQNSQAAAWVPTWIGNSFQWTAEAIQQELKPDQAVAAIGADKTDPESEQHLPRPFKAGRKARFEGKQLDTNPNEKESAQWSSWNAGWEAGGVQ